MLSLKVAASLGGSYNSSRGLVAGTGALSASYSLSFAEGTAAGQADGLFTFTDGITAGEAQSFGLFSGLIDLYGQTLEFSAVKAILIEADPANTAPLIVGGGGWIGPFGAETDTLVVRPGQLVMLVCGDATGWPVDPSADVLQISCTADAAYGLSIVGVSTAVSPPVCAVRPFISTIPEVGLECFCTDGDWSGSPEFHYQWKRGGVSIVGATSAAYTPVQGDLGFALSRMTFAKNSAGAVAVSSNAVNVGGENDLDLDSGNIGLTAVT